MPINDRTGFDVCAGFLTTHDVLQFYSTLIQTIFMAMKIYTKTGDTGNTSLIGGTKVSKSHPRIEAYGTVDELNSYIGLCKDLLADKNSNSTLQEIQDRLFTIGAALACDPDKETKMKIPDLKEEDITLLEIEIDKMNDALPPMKSFILPGGHPTVSHLHVARCICRRAERCCVRLQIEKNEVEPIIPKYLNRLSDYLFILARYAALLLSVREMAWKPRI
jgi:cob(I)alamin adenosyltransferase